MRMALPSRSTRTFWRFGSQTRLVLLLAWLTLLPLMGPLPHISQILDILTLPFRKSFYKPLWERCQGELHIEVIGRIDCLMSI